MPEEELRPRPPFRLRLRHLLAPYLAGLAWFLLHPLASVVTGELKCRGAFIDENSLEPGMLRARPYLPSGSSAYRRDRGGGGEDDDKNDDDGEDPAMPWSLCDAVAAAEVSVPPFAGGGIGTGTGTRTRTGTGGPPPPPSPRIRALASMGNVMCLSPPGAPYDVVRIVPAGPPAEPAEALVLVAGGPGGSSGTAEDWDRSGLHGSLLELVGRLADPAAAPWLAKTVLLVVPRHGREVGEAAAAFVGSYLGGGGGQGQGQGQGQRLPPSITSCLLRAALVIETGEGAPGAPPDLRLLPQGRGGILPNLDLFFAVAKVFGTDYGGMMAAGRAWRGGRIRAYPASLGWADRAERAAEAWAGSSSSSSASGGGGGPLGLPRLPPSAARYASDLIGLLAFGATQVAGPFPPHGPFLDRGIDALTLWVGLPPPGGGGGGGGREGGGTAAAAGGGKQQLEADLVQGLERTVRALSNLHERLHHSVTQYLLPGPAKFVSNGEYTYPGVLVLLPLALRAAGLVLGWDDDSDRHGGGASSFSSFSSSSSSSSSSPFPPSSFRPSGRGMAVVLICLAVPPLFAGWLGLEAWAGGGRGRSTGEQACMLSALYAAALLGIRLCVTRGRRRRRKGTDKEKEEGGGVRGVRGGGGTGEPDLDLGREEPDIGRTVQFVACLLGTYLHVPLLLGHVALFVPSALLWTAVLALIVPPLLSLSASLSASLSSSSARGLVGWDPRFGAGAAAAAAAGGVAALGPMVVLVPGLIGSYTPYVVGVYLPLHLLLASLTVLSLSS